MGDLQEGKKSQCQKDLHTTINISLLLQVSYCDFIFLPYIYTSVDQYPEFLLLHVKCLLFKLL